ncbi:hypothetical protein H6P81_000562 [Aristolochia fimbriata]|uniref:IBH1-like N-terminal domain-containing protein n=1 Tax=Aristolochia fimbriata TaxID=158543 RepID=A0AAV7F605_ARIFI|nr:hypothetical protein H6P81_000562 [Aristolochia fimbriata]
MPNQSVFFLRLYFESEAVPKLASSRLQVAMQVTSTFKRDFLRKLLLGLQQNAIPSKSMSLIERKRAVKVSSDVALAASREGGAKWSRALITDLSKQESSKTIVRNMLGTKEFHRLIITNPILTTYKKVQSGSMLKRSSLMRRMIRKRSAVPKKSSRSTTSTSVGATTLAKRIQRRRTQILKALVPGGHYMDDLSLLDETVDYVLCLKAQVDGMRYLANVFEQQPRA